MERSNTSGKIALFFALLGACALVYTFLAAVILGYFLNIVGPTPVMLSWIQFFVAAVVISACTLLLLVNVAALIKLRDWVHFHRMMRKYRELEHERQQLEVPLSGHKRITHAPYMHSAVRRSSSIHRPEY